MSTTIRRTATAAAARAIDAGTLEPPVVTPMAKAVAPVTPTIAICGQVSPARCAALRRDGFRGVTGA